MKNAGVGTFSQGTQRPVVNARFEICKISVRVSTDHVRFGKKRIKRATGHAEGSKPKAGIED